MRINIVKLSFIFAVISICFLSINLFGEDKWQKGKKYSDLFSPTDSTIYKEHGGQWKNPSLNLNVGGYCYLYRGRSYGALYPLLNNITKADKELPSDLVTMYRINYYAL